MDHYAFLLGYLDKQLQIIEKLYREIIAVDVAIYAERYVFAVKTQQLYTSLEDLFKQIAKSFENHIDKLDAYHKELLIRMNTDIPNTRPAVVTTKSFLFLDKLRAFRHFIRHAYDCELDPEALKLLQAKLKQEFTDVEEDIRKFRQYLREIA